MNATYKVSGMSCDGCASAVKKAIAKSAPSARVEVDLGAKTVSVDGGADDAAIRKAIEGAGFEYEGRVA